jgi:hypothetical protein
MKWLEKRFYLFWIGSLAALVVATYFQYRFQALEASDPVEHLRTARSPNEKKAAFDAFNQHLKARAEAIDYKWQAFILFVLLFAVGLGLFLRHKGVTHRTLLRRWRSIALATVAIALLASIYVLDLYTHMIRGFLRGEKFCAWQASSYWKAKLKAGLFDRRMEETLIGSPQSSVPMLIDLTLDDDPNVRSTALYVLGRCEDQAEPALGQIIQALADPEPNVRFAAITALKRVHPDRRAALEKIKPLVDDSNVAVARNAASTLWELDPDAAVERFGWEEFRSRSLGFRAMMPPGVQTEEVPSFWLADATTTLHLAEFNGTLLVVAVTDHAPERLQELTDDERFKEAVSRLQESLTAALNERGTVRQGELEGRELKLAALDPRTIFWIRAFRHGNRFYQVGAVSNRHTRPEGGYFLDSFRVAPSEP